MLTKDPQGIEHRIGNIPVVIVNDHYEAFHYWEKYKLHNATLLHVDAHPDIFDGVMVENPANPELRLNINDFICPAFHYGIVSSIYWINPHSTDRFIQYLGSKNNDGAKLLATKEVPAHAFESWRRILWDEEKCGKFDGAGYIYNPHLGINVSESQVRNEGDIILDIDLDAFCCDRAIFNVHINYDGIKGYEDRIERTIGVLKMLKQPSLITIASSQGAFPDIGRTYVPHDLVDKVQECTLERLNGLYGNLK